MEIAKRIGSSQSRIAKMEVADKSVSLDLLVRSLLSLGETRHDIAGTIRAPVTKKNRNRPVAKKHAATGQVAFAEMPLSAIRTGGGHAPQCHPAED